MINSQDLPWITGWLQWKADVQPPPRARSCQWAPTGMLRGKERMIFLLMKCCFAQGTILLLLFIIYALLKVCTVLYSAIKKNDWCPVPRDVAPLLKYGKGARWRGWFSLHDDAGFCYCYRVSSSDHLAGDVRVALSPFCTIVYDRVCKGMYPVWYAFGVWQQWEWVNNKSATVTAPGFFYFYRFSAICCLTSCSQCSTKLISIQELSPSRRAGAVGLEVHNWPPVHCLQDPDLVSNSREMGSKCRERVEELRFKHMATWTLIHPLQNTGHRVVLACRAVGGRL